jgi:hypothetical protein
MADASTIRSTTDDDSHKYVEMLLGLFTKVKIKERDESFLSRIIARCSNVGGSFASLDLGANLKNEDDVTQFIEQESEYTH